MNSFVVMSLDWDILIKKLKNRCYIINANRCIPDLMKCQNVMHAEKKYVLMNYQKSSIVLSVILKKSGAAKNAKESPKNTSVIFVVTRVQVIIIN